VHPYHAAAAAAALEQAPTHQSTHVYLLPLLSLLLLVLVLILLSRALTVA
jgi:hypothetical protein